MFEFTDRSKDYLERIQAFMDSHVYPAEEAFEEQTANLETRWNGFPPHSAGAEGQGQGRGVVEYVHPRRPLRPRFVKL